MPPPTSKEKPLFTTEPLWESTLAPAYRPLLTTKPLPSFSAPPDDIHPQPGWAFTPTTNKKAVYEEPRICAKSLTKIVSTFASTIERPLSIHETAGTIYCFRIEGPPTSPNAALFKVGRTINYDRRKFEWDTQCPSQRHFWFPPILVTYCHRTGGFSPSVVSFRHTMIPRTPNTPQTSRDLFEKAPRPMRGLLDEAPGGVRVIPGSGSANVRRCDSPGYSEDGLVGGGMPETVRVECVVVFLGVTTLPAAS
ncbi:hypothetical protein V5O48_014984 [Marasmius crinis-equi]|uniref:Uncharacterized protein n=1 Tax=Marasmius crinis-equi TaxID=585013 RepID=A0ABR3EVS5_9AGAR